MNSVANDQTKVLQFSAFHVHGWGTSCEVSKAVSCSYSQTPSTSFELCSSNSCGTSQYLLTCNKLFFHDFIRWAQLAWEKTTPKWKRKYFDEERLQLLGLHSLQRRRLQAGLISALKIFKGLLDINPNLFFLPPARRGLRGRPFKVLQGANHRRRRGSAFLARVVK